MSELESRYLAQTMQQGSKSFATASKLFAPSIRQDALMLYAWCRHCDDAIDNQHLGFNKAAQPAQPSSQVLENLKQQTHRVYAGEVSEEPAFKALQKVSQRHEIEQDLALAHLQGYAMDVNNQRYNQLTDTLEYCYHVAGVVGLMMAKVMGVRNSESLNRACDLGLAFQLTNIARDIVEDAQQGRCYLPLSWLEASGISTQENVDFYSAITAPENRPKIAQIASQLVDHAEPYYQSAKQGLPALSWRSAWAVATALLVYRAIGQKLLKAGEKGWDQRQSTNKFEKLALLCKAVFMATRSRWQTPTQRSSKLWQRPTY